MLTSLSHTSRKRVAFLRNQKDVKDFPNSRVEGESYLWKNR